jgi:hypothetical protein
MNQNLFNITYAMIMLSLAIAFILILEVNELGDGFLSFLIGFTLSIIYWTTRDKLYNYIENLIKVDDYDEY